MAIVSIYIPTHNRRILLEGAVNSVRAQTYQSLEIIVVNDSSSDDTRSYLDKLARAESRLVAIHSDRPLGAGAARNAALRRASGEFVTGLDDDDQFLPDRIQTFVTEWNALGVEQERTSCLFTESIMKDEARSFVTTDRKEKVSYSDLFRHNFIGNQVFCPRQRLLEIGGFDENLPAWEDLDLFMRLLKRYGPARRVSGASYICHVERSRPRISSSAANHYLAYEKIIDKNSAQMARQQSELFLQLFSPFYGTIPSASDWARMFRLRAPPILVVKLLKAAVRNSLRKFL